MSSTSAGGRTRRPNQRNSQPRTGPASAARVVRSAWLDSRLGIALDYSQPGEVGQNYSRGNIAHRYCLSGGYTNAQSSRRRLRDSMASMEDKRREPDYDDLPSGDPNPMWLIALFLGMLLVAFAAVIAFS